MSEKPFFKHSKPLNFAHRGFSGKFPEHTFLSFRNAIAAGAEALELDVRLTRDNRLMIIHDETLERTTNGSGYVRDNYFIDLEKLNAGYKFLIDGKKQVYPSLKEDDLRIPSLSQLFNEFPKCRFNIDIKQNDKKTCEILWDLIREYKIQDKVLVASDNHETIKYFRNVSKGNTATAASFKEVGNFILHKGLGILKRLNFDADAMQIPEHYFGVRLLSEKFIQEAHKKNIFIHIWTVNQKADMERLLKWGVDGIMTDFPDTLNELLKNYN